MTEVLIYSKEICPYCVRAKELLKRKGVDYTEFMVDQDPALLEEMLSKSNGLRTVPQIFIGSHHVGGCDDLYELDRKGELDSLLQGE